jgi:hypothetical protein
MKTETKHFKKMEKKTLALISILFFAIALLIIPTFSATIEFWQQKYQFNNTLQDHLVFFYLSKTEFNFVTTGKPLEVFLTYSMFPKSWNEDNPNFKISSCNLSVYYSSHLENQSQFIFSHIVTQYDADIYNAKYFVRLKNENDGVIADLSCDFISNVPVERQMASNLVISSPTWECKSCQYYDWNIARVDGLKSNQLRSYSTSVLDYIKQLFTSLYELILAFFWIFMILMLFSAVALIFIGIYWLYLYLVKLAK